MPNEQTSVPLFTSGEVLTAANMNISAGTGVPVFASTTTRDAAFGGANEKTLAEGQLCYLSDSNVVQYYSGAAWATVGPASAGALVYITGASFTSQTTVSMAAGVFTSTYQNYMVILVGSDQAATQTQSLRVNVSGSPQSGGSYTGARVNAGNGSTITCTGSISQTSFQYVSTSGGGDYVGATTIMVYDPVRNGITKFSTQSAHQSANWSGGLYDTNGIHDGLTFIFSQSTTGNYKVYGVANS